VRQGAIDVAFGYDEGLVVIKLGYDESSLSMDPSGTRNADVEITEGQSTSVATREMGSTKVCDTSLQHSPNGHFITIVGNGEYIIYTARTWRYEAFGRAYLSHELEVW